MNDAPTKPTPPDNDVSRPYWQAAARGDLTIQKCAECGVLRHYPRLLCDQCYSDQVTWITATGRGVIHSWTVAHHPYHPAFREELPYTLVTVDLEEGPRALGRWRGDTPSIGQAVEGCFEFLSDTPDLVFQPSTPG
jgi:uncharacterized OB-fold protein